MINTVVAPPHVVSVLVEEREPDTPSAVDSADTEEAEPKALEVDSMVRSVSKVLIEVKEAATLAVTKTVEVPFAKVSVSVLEKLPSSEVEELKVPAAAVKVVVEMVMVTVADEVEVTVDDPVVHVVEFHSLTTKICQPLLF